jgi:hypothetical protein
MDDINEAEPAASGGAVVNSVLDAFLTALADEEGFADVAGRLRKTLLEDGKRSEAALRAALFEGDAA